MNGQEFLVTTRNLADRIGESAESFAAYIEAQASINRPMVLAVDEDNQDDNDANFKMDMALLRAAPVAAVPKYSPFFRLAVNGHRFLLASDGLYLEVRRSWLHFIQRVAEQTAVSMPYGQVTPCAELAFGRISAAMPHISTFTDRAQAVAPNEHMALIAWDNDASALIDLQVEITDATPGSVDYTHPELAEYETIAIDLHSHGAHPAFFSATDNRDDAGSVKIAGVIGGLGTDKPTAMFRLCVLGLYIPIPVPVERIFEGQ